SLLPATFFLCLFFLHPAVRLCGQSPADPFIVVLGIAQDAGYPHIGCTKECCQRFYDGKEKKHFVSSLAIVDPASGQRFLFDCTPDFPAQVHLLDSLSPPGKTIDGIFLTHAHIGHYTGLMYLGRESMNASSVKVYTMPEMHLFLQNNGPWSLLVQLQNIELHKMKADSVIRLNESISVTPFLVPHRHEFTETVGYKISIGKKSVIFIPDIDKWNKWDSDILQLVKENDLLFIDGTFFRDGEIAGRNMSAIPHPFIEESMKLFDHLPAAEKAKIHFIHLNHTNPALIKGSDAQHEIEQKGFHVAKEGAVMVL
ncbi:MAG TPA: MBL fold metallo-hydrolase, partial [Chitinophagales bacterium]|nr:MBL fold metallo-hydrolase [Chitinophagales bacterium]